MTIRIQSITTRIINHPLHPHRIIVAHVGRHALSEFLEVVVRDTDGAQGYGEAATTAMWSGETARTAQWMVEQCFAPLLVNRGFEHPREALAIMDKTAVGNPYAKAAVDTALWDLWARSRGVAATQLFADRAPVAALPTRISIAAGSVEQTVALAREFWGAGIRTLKFKVGVAGCDDIARLRAVREALGDAPAFVVDANGAYATVDEAVRAVEAMRPFRVELVEQPTPRDRIGLLAQVRRRLDVPILADEAVFTPDHLAEALDCDAFDYLAISPGKNGGFTRSIEMAETAQKAGKHCAIGSNLETDLGQASMAALAAGLSAFPVETLPGDLGASMYYQRPSTKPELALTQGSLVLPGGPGFGVEPRP